MSKKTPTASSPMVPVKPREITPIEPPRRVSGRMLRIAAEFETQRAVIAGEQQIFREAAQAGRSVYECAYEEFVGLAEAVVARQREERDPEAQRWVDWSAERILPLGEADLARIAHTGVYLMAEAASHGLYQGPEEEKKPGLRERFIGR